jgi:hypothetical protein
LIFREAETAGAKTFVYISAAGVIMNDAGAPKRLNGGAVASVQYIGESVTAIWVAAKVWQE